MSTNTTLNYFIPQTRDAIIERYGNIATLEGQLAWPNCDHWLKPCYVQPEIAAVLINAESRKPVEHIFSNIDMHKPLLDAFQLVINRALAQELKTFDGCYNVRYVRGRDGIYSIHSWGIAIDLNAADNPLAGSSSWSPEFVDCFKSVGFTWGGEFKRPDPMHFQWAASF